MDPIRILLVEDSFPLLRALRRDLEAAGGFEVFQATSAGAGVLSLSRTNPDVLILNPYAGGGSVEEWRRAIERYRTTRPLSLLALGRKDPSRDVDVLADLADLGVLQRPAGPRRILTLLMSWIGQDDVPLRRAS